MLKEEDEGGGLKKGDVGAEELRFAEFGWSMRWRLLGRVSRWRSAWVCHLRY